MGESKVIAQVKGVSKSYRLGKARLEVLRGVDLAVRTGEFVAVMGASGSGKSTLLHILGLLDRPDEGTVWFEGRDVYQLRERARVRMRNRELGFVFQFYHLLPELSVEENVMLPLMVGSTLTGWLGARRRARQRAGELLEAVGLADRRGQRPVTLSGGERQRVAIARALATGPKVLLADEPTGNLDSHAGGAILEHLERLNRAGQTLVLVTHDAAVAARAGQVVVLRDGKVAPREAGAVEIGRRRD